MKDNHYLSNTVIDKILGFMGTTGTDEFLAAEIKEAGMFAIIADETTYVSHKEQLSVSIRWVDHDFEIYETPIELIHVLKTDAETISSLKQECLEQDILPISQCQGQENYGAANMSGHL